MNCRLERFRIEVSACLLSLIVYASLHAAAPKFHQGCMAEITRVASVQQAVAEVIDAKIEFETWQLGQLESLRERGHATWLEVARQQLATDILHRRRSAITAFNSYCELLRRRVSRASAAADQDERISSESAVAPIKLSMGSVRLVGWMEADPTPSNTLGLLAASAQLPPRPTRDDRKLSPANAKLASAEKRCKVYATLESITPNQLRQAELLCSIARAEAQLHRIEFDRQATSATDYATLHVDWDENQLDADIPGAATGWFDDHLTPRSNRGLGLATLRVAEAEATADGELQAARIASRRFQRRHESLEELYARGYATKHELDNARDQLADANQRAEELLRQRTKLTQACRILRRSLLGTELAESAPPGESRRAVAAWCTSRTIDELEWPSSTITNLHVLRHVIELRRDYVDSVALGEEWQLKAVLLDEYRTKLQQSVANTPESTLSAGMRRQLDDLEFEIRYCRARQIAAQEKRAILAAEEQRFMLQCLTQDQIQHAHADLTDAKSSTDLMSSPEHTSKTVSLVRAPAPGATRLSYLESECFGQPETLRFSVPVTTWDKDLWLDFCREDLHPAWDGAWTRCYASPGSRISRIAGDIGPHLSPAALTEDDFPASYSEGRFRSVFRTRRAYEFGILRGDLRNRLTPGQSPWYLPGSATNLRQQ